MNRKELFMKKRKIATILLAACLLLGNVSVANAASIDNGNKVHFNTEDNDTDLTLLQSKIATEEVTCDFTDATNDGASAYADTRRVSNKYMWSASTMEYNFSDQKWTSNTEIFSTYAKTSEGFVMSGFLLNPKGQSNYNSALREGYLNDSAYDENQGHYYQCVVSDEDCNNITFMLESNVNVFI